MSKSLKKILIIDNYDSFTYNLVHIVEEIVGDKVVIKKNDRLTLAEVNAFDYIILSPGPGLPDESGLLKAIIKKYRSSKKILGVCLGLQAIGEVYGSKLKNLKNVYHGIQSEIVQSENKSVLFKNVPKKFKAGRYHSWVIDPDSLVDELYVTSHDLSNQIMSIEHKTDKVYAVQFHPESIMTPYGKKMIQNFLDLSL